MDLVKLLMSQLGDNGLDAMAQKAGMNTNQAASALEGIVPTLLGTMAKNTSTNDGANGLLGALDRDHDGSVLDDVMGFIGGGNSERVGSGILKHVLGGNTQSVENSLADKVGVSSSGISSLMKMAAPLLMGMLGKQRKESSNSGFDAGNIGSVLSGLAGNSDANTGLDLGDVFSMVGALTGNRGGFSSGVGGLLKGLFGGK
ncbi:MAG: hypothetical protein ACI8XB_000861 [Patiriisocius sp.]|jgi:hypothetical protein